MKVKLKCFKKEIRSQKKAGLSSSENEAKNISKKK
jgi:hypothetical protein